MRRILAPARRMSSISFSCLGRSITTTTRSSTWRSRHRAIAFRLSATGASRSTAFFDLGPTISFSMNRSGAWSRPPGSEAASTEIAPGIPSAQRLVPSSGSTAMSMRGKRLAAGPGAGAPARPAHRCRASALRRARLPRSPPCRRWGARPCRDASPRRPRGRRAAGRPAPSCARTRSRRARRPAGTRERGRSPSVSLVPRPRPRTPAACTGRAGPGGSRAGSRPASARGSRASLRR